MGVQRKVVGWFTRGGKHIPIYDDAIENGRDFQPVDKKYAKKKSAELDEAKATYAKRPWRDDLIDKKYNAQAKVDDVEDRGTIKGAKFNGRPKSIAERNEEIKQRQIAEAQAQRDRLNGRQTLQERVASDADMKKTIAEYSKKALSFDREDTDGRAQFMSNLHKQADLYASKHGLDKMQVRRALYDSVIDRANKLDVIRKSPMFQQKVMDRVAEKVYGKPFSQLDEKQKNKIIMARKQSDALKARGQKEKLNLDKNYWG